MLEICCFKLQISSSISATYRDSFPNLQEENLKISNTYAGVKTICLVFLNVDQVCADFEFKKQKVLVCKPIHIYLSGDRSIILPEIGSFLEYRVFFQVFQSFSKARSQTLVVRTCLKRIQWNSLNIMAIKDFTFYTEDKVAKSALAIFSQMAWKDHVIADLR